MGTFRPTEADLIAWAEATDEAAARHGDDCEECVALQQLSDYLMAVVDDGTRLPAVEME